MRFSRNVLSFLPWLVAGLLLLGGCGSRAGSAEVEVRALYNFGTRSQSYYLLLPGNRIFEGIPNGGLDGFDFEKAKAEHPKECGTYALDGDRMKITWGGGRAAETWKHTTTNGGKDEQMDGAAWMKGEPFKSGQRLDGRYTLSAGTGGVSVYRELTFRPDGTYTRKAVGATRTDAGGGYSQTDDTGTYTFDGYLLTLKGADGKTTRWTAFVEVKGTDEAKPGIIVCDGQKMTLARS